MGGSRGKLKAAARWLLEPGDEAAFDSDDEAEAALRELGVPADQVQAARAADGDGNEPALPVWAQHLAAMRVFGAMRSQWRVAGTPPRLVYLGMDYAALPAALQGLGLGPLEPELFDQLQVMERAGRHCLNTM